MRKESHEFRLQSTIDRALVELLQLIHEALSDDSGHARLASEVRLHHRDGLRRVAMIQTREYIADKQRVMKIMHTRSL